MIKKSHTFKSYQVAGLEDIYNMKVVVKDYVLTITMTDQNGYKEISKYKLDNSLPGITKEQAENYLAQFFEMTIDLELIK
jgi:hypothetical protein